MQVVREGSLSRSQILWATVAAAVCLLVQAPFAGAELTPPTPFVLAGDGGAVPFSIIYRGQNSTGDGIMRELSRFGCRIVGNDSVENDSLEVDEMLSVQIALPTSEQPLFIGQTTVKWVKRLDFGLAFHRFQGREADRLERLLDALPESKSSGSLKVAPPTAWCLVLVL